MQKLWKWANPDHLKAIAKTQFFIGEDPNFIVEKPKFLFSYATPKVTNSINGKETIQSVREEADQDEENGNNRLATYRVC
jgi:hypothetical protein